MGDLYAMSKEVRAVVLGLVVVVLAAIALAFWRGPAPEFRRIKGFRVEVVEKGRRRDPPDGLPRPRRPARRPRDAHPLDESFDGDLREAWGKGRRHAPRHSRRGRPEQARTSPGSSRRTTRPSRSAPRATSLEIDVKEELGQARAHPPAPATWSKCFAEDHRASPRAT